VFPNSGATTRDKKVATTTDIEGKKEKTQIIAKPPWGGGLKTSENRTAFQEPQKTKVEKQKKRRRGK